MCIRDRFAGLTAVLAKCGIRKTDSTVATAIRTIVVLVFSWLMVFLVGSQSQITQLGGKTLLFLILSGLATGASWLCYFRALQIGDINKVVPVDKSSTVLTILLAVVFLHESLSLAKGAGIVCIAAGTYLMIEKKQSSGAAKTGASWLLYAAGSAVFASLTSILGKVGISGVESSLGTAIRTGVVLVMSWMMVFVTGKGAKLREVPVSYTHLDVYKRQPHVRSLRVFSILLLLYYDSFRRNRRSPASLSFRTAWTSRIRSPSASDS